MSDGYLRLNEVTASNLLDVGIDRALWRGPASEDAVPDSARHPLPATTDQRVIHHRRGAPLRLPGPRSQGTGQRP